MIIINNTRLDEEKIIEHQNSNSAKEQPETSELGN